MLLLITGLVLFLGLHLLPSFPAAKTAMTARYGATVFIGTFSLVAAAGLGLIIFGFGEARANPTAVWRPPQALRPIAMLLLLPVFPLLAAAFLPTGRLKAWTRHPMITAVFLWAAAHLLANGFLHEILFFGGFLVWALFNRIAHVRLDADAPRPALTANAWRFDLIAVIVGFGLYAFLIHGAHRWITGVPVI